MTLQQCIDRYHAAAVTPMSRPTAVLTPLGHAAVAAHRLVRQLRALSQSDRSVIVRMLVAELEEARHAS